MTRNMDSFGPAQCRAGAVALLTAAGVLFMLVFATQSAWGSQAAPEDGTPESASPSQVVFQVGAEPFAYGLRMGDSVTLPISMTVTGPQGLAAASVLVQYDNHQLRPTACIRRVDGPYGYCNVDYDRANGLVRFTLLSQAGIMDTAMLFDLTFEAASNATMHREVEVTPLIESLCDLQGNYMTSSARGSTVRIEEPPDPGTIVFVGAPAQTEPFAVTHGMTVTVPIWVTGAAALGSATFSLSFDLSLVRATACLPVQSPDGGAFGTCAVHDNHVRANLMAPGGLGGPIIAFQAVFTAAGAAPEGGSSPLTLSLDSFSDMSGAPLTARVSNNSLVISPAAGPAAAVLRLAPPDQGIERDGRVTMHVFLDTGTRLAAGSWGVHYDPRLLQVDSCRPSTAVMNALCNPTGESGLVRMTLLASDPLPETLDFGTITWRRHPDAQAGEVASLTFSVTNFADRQGAALPYATRGATVRITNNLGPDPAVIVRLQDAPADGYPLPRGGSLDLPIAFQIDAARPIGSLSGTLRYDPRVLRATRCLRGATESSEAPAGYCNAQYDTAAGLVKFNLVSAAGVSGALTPFTLTVEAASGAADGQASPLDLNLEVATGTNGVNRVWQAQDSSVLLLSPVPAARVLIGPPPPASDGIYQLGTNSTATVPLWVDAVVGLGAATVAVRYDDTITRAVKCTVRSDLTPAVDGGFCALLPGTVQMAFISSGGITGTAHVFDIVFANAPNVAGGESTALAINVTNFVDTADVPIPTAVRVGRIDVIACIIPPPVLSIALPAAEVELTWPHITLDICGQPMQVAYYEVWRDATPYAVTASAPIDHVPVAPGSLANTIFGFTEAPPAPEAGLAVYRIVAVAADGRRSDFSNPKAALSYRLVRGSPVLR